MPCIKEQERNAEEGQSLVEFAVGLPFVLLVIIVLVEMGLVFVTYISMINAAREGAIFASMHPELINSANDNDILSPGTTTIWQEYQDRVRNEVYVVTTQQLRSSRLLTQDDIDVARPFVDGGASAAGDPITVTVTYSLTTFTSGISLPFFDRFGLPNQYRLVYSFGMPIR